jgi:vancomycin resistance protein YoaR
VKAPAPVAEPLPATVLAELPPRRLRTGMVARGFALGLLGTLAVAALTAALAGLSVGWLNEGRILPGVRAAGVPLAGLDRGAAEARLRAALPSLSSGSATLVAEDETVSVPYARFGRGYDAASMAGQAYAVGRSGNPLSALVARLRSLLAGEEIPPMVHASDQAALDEISRSLAATYTVPPVNARVTYDGAAFQVAPSVAGSRLDADAVRRALLGALDRPDAADATIDLPVSRVDAPVTTGMATTAAIEARRIAATPLTLTGDGTTITLTPDDIAPLVSFALDDAGALRARVTIADADAAAGALATKVNRSPVDATYRFVNGAVRVVAGQTGLTLDVTATARSIADALSRRADPGPPSYEMPLAVSVMQPAFSTEQAQAAVSNLKRISTWTTYYVPGISNGYGVNISIPARALDGKVIQPGAMFDFWKEIGPVTLAAGYRYGGAIIGGKSEETGALAGGICSTSTTLFNTALRAGLEMHARLNHYYYISRYPVGLDATVYSDTGWTQTMSFRNDTPYPLIIRAYTGYGYVRFDLYGVPTGRKVTLTTPIITNRTYGHDTVEYTSSLPAGQTRRVEGIINGFDASVTRYVYDANGALIHEDHFFSHYSAVNGVVLVGTGGAAPTPSP